MSAALLGMKCWRQNADHLVARDCLHRRFSAQSPCSRTDASGHRAPTPSLAPQPAPGCRASAPAARDGWRAACRSPLRETTGFNVISATRPSVAAKFLESDRALMVVASMLLLVVSVAPSCETSSAICSAFRLAVPSSSIAATKFARPGLSIGFASLPVLITRFAATIGNPRRSLSMSVSPFGEHG